MTRAISYNTLFYEDVHIWLLRIIGSFKAGEQYQVYARCNIAGGAVQGRLERVTDDRNMRMLVFMVTQDVVYQMATNAPFEKWKWRLCKFQIDDTDLLVLKGIEMGVAQAWAKQQSSRASHWWIQMPLRL